MKMLFQKGRFGVVLGGAKPLVPCKCSARRPPVPCDLIWVLCLIFLPQYQANNSTFKIITAKKIW
jgi:hypothetical protein